MADDVEKLSPRRAPTQNRDKSADVLEHWVTADDGWRLNVLDLPAATKARGVAIVSHAMMVDRRTVYRRRGPCLSRSLAAGGFRVLVPDQRGHGRSGPTADQGGIWTYDQLVADVGRFIELGQVLEPDLPLFLLGNSLFGHLSLAYLGFTPGAPVSGVVAFSVNIWNRRWTTDPRRLARKIALVSASWPVVRLLGRLPCRRLRLGNVDEPADYWRSMYETTLGNRWGADDGRDYAAGLVNIRCPVLHVLSDGDRLLSHPDDALLYSAGLGPRRHVLRLGPQCDVPSLRGLAPGHVEMVSSPSCEPIWQHAASWMARVATGGLDGNHREQ
jgi:predicted alpha/beta hydrolase